MINICIYIHTYLLYIIAVQNLKKQQFLFVLQCSLSFSPFFREFFQFLCGLHFAKAFHGFLEVHPSPQWPHGVWKKFTEGHIWLFPKIGVPPNHPILIGFSIINHPFWGKHPYFWKHAYIYMGVSKNSGIPKWMVYNGKPYQNGMIWGYHYFRKHPYI